MVKQAMTASGALTRRDEHRHRHAEEAPAGAALAREPVAAPYSPANEAALSATTPRAHWPATLFQELLQLGMILKKLESGRPRKSSAAHRAGRTENRKIPDHLGEFRHLR
jgi:hypothetical protein